MIDNNGTKAQGSSNIRLLETVNEMKYKLLHSCVRKRKSAASRKTLTKADIDFLKKHTDFTEIDITEWFSIFIEVNSYMI